MTEQEREQESNLQCELSNFVDREVIYCVSSLVYELAQKSEYMDDLMSVCSHPMWTHEFSYTCTNERKEDENGDTEECGESWEEEDDEPRPQEWSHVDDIDDLSVFTMACPKCDTMTEPDEVRAKETDADEAYEHWIVTNWFADKLEERGEMVLRDFLGLTIWGRTTTGQAIHMDWIIGDIYKSLQK